MLGSIVKYISNQFVTLIGWDCPDYRLDVKSSIKNALYIRDMDQFLCLINYVDLDSTDKPKDTGNASICDGQCTHVVGATLFGQPIMLDDEEDYRQVLMPIPRKSFRTELAEICLHQYYIDPIVHLLPNTVEEAEKIISQCSIYSLDIGGKFTVKLLQLLINKYGQINIFGGLLGQDVIAKLSEQQVQKLEDVINGAENSVLSRDYVFSPSLAKDMYEYIMENYTTAGVNMPDIAIGVINAGIDIDIEVLRQISIQSAHTMRESMALKRYLRVLEGVEDNIHYVVNSCLMNYRRLEIHCINILKDKVTFDELCYMLSSDAPKDPRCVQILTDTLTPYAQRVLLHRMKNTRGWNPLSSLDVLLTLTKIDKSLIEEVINEYLGDLTSKVEIRLK